MAISMFLLAAPAVLVAYIILSFVRAYWSLRNFKGPKLAAWSDLPFLFWAHSGKAHVIFGDLVDQYGQMVRVAPNMLMTDDEDFVRRMNSVRSEYKKASWYKPLKMDGNFDNVLSETENGNHMNLRNKLVNGYAGTGNPNFERDIDTVMWDVVNVIDKKYLSRNGNVRPFDHSAVMQYLTLDVVTSLSLGKAFGFVKEDKDIYEYCQTMWGNFPVMNFLMSYPPIISLLSLPAVQRNTAPSMKDRAGLGKIKGVAFDLVRQRFQEKQASKDTRQDMMDSFIKHGLNEQQIADNVLVQLLAGSDTTVSILRTSFVHIISNAKIYQRLQAECDEASKDVPLTEIISYNRATQIPYLDACIKEALRYHPAATGSLPRVVPKAGDYYNGKFLPAGTVIGQARWNMSRKNKVYGEDCEVFRPERWLEATGETLSNMERSNELLFMVGAHRCLGEKIAKMELYKMTFELIRRYNVASLTPLQPIETSINYGIWMQRGMLLRVEERIATPQL